jgi:hypothetical protein
MTWPFGGELGGTRTPSLLIRRYLSGVQRRPDRSASWHDRDPRVRTRSPGWEAVRPGGSQVGSRGLPLRCAGPHVCSWE